MARRLVSVKISREVRGTVYTAIATRRNSFDTLMWQVPALGLTAQAFLLTIAYGGSSSQVARCVGGGLSMLVALVAIQTMSKHRANELTDALSLEAMEASWGVKIGNEHPHAAPRERGTAVDNKLFNNKLFKSWFATRRSFYLWVALLVGFAAAGVAAIVLSLANESILSFDRELRSD